MCARLEINGDTRPGLCRLAVVTAATTLFLLFVGGTVTSNNAGLAVPDWPTSFGHHMLTYPPSEWKAGIFFEHTHRLLGAAVGLLTLLLAAAAQLFDRRAWLRTVAWLMLLAVIAQGIMGGLRVTERSIHWAIFHGCFAQLFLASTACMVLFTSGAWRRPTAPSQPAAGQPAAGQPAAGQPAATTLHALCIAANLAIFAQLIAGAFYRHTGIGLIYHVAGAFLVTIFVCLVAMCITGWHGDQPVLASLARWIGLLLIVQLALGVGAWIAATRYAPDQPASFWQWFVPSVHLAVGAAIFALSVVATVAAFRFLKPVSLEQLSTAPGAASS